MKLRPVKQDNDFCKDEDSSAILNTNIDALNAYKLQKKKRNAIEEDINNIKGELKEIKDILNKIVSSYRGN